MEIISEGDMRVCMPLIKDMDLEYFLKIFILDSF